MKSLRFISSFILFTLCISLLAGCHGAVELTSFEIPEGFDMTKNHEITFWAKNENNPTQRQIYQDAIDNFQSLYPNIKVTIKNYSDYSRLYNDVITNISTRTTPNVCVTYPDHIATYMTGANAVVPLDEFFYNEEYGLAGTKLKYEGVKKEEIIPQFLKECLLDGTYYALPFMRSTEACYVNKTYVEKLGYTLPETLTWDFIYQVSEAAMEKDASGNFKVNGQNVMIPFIYKSTDNMMIQMLKQKNAGYSTDRGEVLIFNDTTKALLEEIAVHAGTGAFSTFSIDGYPGNFFNAGQCIFAIDSTAGATWIGTKAPQIDIPEEQLVEFEAEVMAIPQFDTENPAMISQGPSLCIFNKEDPQEVLASWLFTQYLLTNNVQIAYSQTEGYIPVTSKAQNSDVYKDYLSREGEDNELYYDIKIKAAKLLLDNTENTFVTPVFNGSASLRNAAGQLIEEVTKSKQRKQEVNDAYFVKLFGDVKSLYRLDQIKLKDTTQSTDADVSSYFETQQSAVEAELPPLGKLPSSSVVLLVVLVVTWVFIGAYFLKETVKKRKK